MFVICDGCLYIEDGDSAYDWPGPVELTDDLAMAIDLLEYRRMFQKIPSLTRLAEPDECDLLRALNGTPTD